MRCEVMRRRVAGRLAMVAGAAAVVSVAGLATAAPIAVVYGIAGQTTTDKSLVPGGLPGFPDARFTNFNNEMYRSPSSNHWLAVATTSATPATADQVLLVGNGLTGNVRAQEGVTEFATGQFINFSRLDVPRINDAGQWALAFRVNGGTNIDEKVVRWNGTSFDLVATSGTLVGALPGQVFIGSFNGANIENSGEVGFLGAVSPASGTTDSAFTDNGNTVVAEIGMTVPTDQSPDSGGASWNDVDSEAFYQNADGSRWIALGEIGFVTTADRVAVVNNVVVLQESVVVAASGFSSPVSTIGGVWMESNGDWFARGSNADGIDWVVRNGAVIAVEGQPVTPGSTELWETFRAMRGNNRGDYIINGNTNADTLMDDVLVLNGQRVVARESDPVDLDGNGLFDDTVFLHLVQEHGVLNNDAYCYFVSRLKNSPTATAGFGTTPNNASLLRVLACPPDVNNSGGVTVQDIFDFLSAYFGNDPAADFNRSGAISVQDIFDFLAAYFVGC